MTESSEDLAKTGRYEEAVVALVRERDYVTFVEISKLLAPYIETRGDQGITVGPSENNVVMWALMSEQFFTIVMSLADSKRIFVHPACYFTYMIDGGGLKLPIVKRVKKYKKPHWAPTCFRLVPMAPAEKRKQRGVR